MDKKLIGVIGATGKQGYAASCALLKSGNFKVRAFVRSATHPKAVELKSKGAETFVVIFAFVLLVLKDYFEVTQFNFLLKSITIQTDTTSRITL